ncbi:lysylphosphatidylglycerol synthase transmembrane domain-containing protein [Rubrolithibacter danxiaensis]|uniref:lysylphosphatidylglycerol synthase transmembrane domain-containing protein n=1 Tax=Rubrolithibacter danxiaensis TaxID=3390805 RepID=UPI003BF8DB62
MNKKKLWDILKLILKIGFTVFLLYLVSLKINFSDVKNLFLKSNPLFILLALLTYFLSQVVSSWRLLSFLSSIGLKLNFNFNFRLYLLGMFYNVFLPGGIGGDGYKIYLLRKKFQHPTKKIFLALFLDRVSGLWAIGFICVALIILIPKLDISPILPIGALAAGTLIYYLILKKFFADYSKSFIKAHIKAGMAQSLQLLAVVFILLSQDFGGKFSPYLFSFLVSSIATIIPVSVGGFGIREYVMTHASGVFNMNQNLAVFITITFSLLSTIAALPGIWFVYRSKEFEPLPTPEEAKEKTDELIS